MGILDDAIREHLELKKRHGAPDRELRQLEEEALGPGDQPDPFTGSGLFEGLGEGGPATPAESAPPPPDAGSEDVTRVVGEVAAPPGSSPSEQAASAADSVAAPSPPEPAPEPGLPEPPTPPPTPTSPASEQPPAPETAEQPSEPPPPPREVDPSELEALDTLAGEDETAPRPARDESAEATAASRPEPELTIPPPPPPGREERPERLSAPGVEAAAGEGAVPEAADLDQAPAARPTGTRPGIADIPTQEHPPPEPPSEEASLPEVEGSEGAASPALYDFETDEAPVEPEPLEPPSDEFESAEEVEPAELDEGPYDEPSADYDEDELAADADEEAEGEDLLSESPDFIDEEAEGEDLWFEKRPPEDFDFEDER